MLVFLFVLKVNVLTCLHIFMLDFEYLTDILQKLNIKVFYPITKNIGEPQENILRQAICNERARGMIKVLTET